MKLEQPPLPEENNDVLEASHALSSRSPEIKSSIIPETGINQDYINETSNLKGVVEMTLQTDYGDDEMGIFDKTTDLLSIKNMLLRTRYYQDRFKAMGYTDEDGILTPSNSDVAGMINEKVDELHALGMKSWDIEAFEERKKDLHDIVEIIDDIYSLMKKGIEYKRAA